MFSDSGVPKTLFFPMSSDSEVPGKGRVCKSKLVECVQIVTFLFIFKHKTLAAEQDGAYSTSIQNVFKLNTPWIQDSRFKVEGKAFSTILNPSLYSTYPNFIQLEIKAWIQDSRFKIPGKLLASILNLESWIQAFIQS